jgi:putative ATP-dependent endonuclease of OLD family
MTQVSLADVRHFRRVGDATEIVALKIEDLEPEDVRKIERQVLATRGELCFSRALIMFEGETEEQAVPLFASEFWKMPHQLTGISFVGVGGSGAYRPFIRMAKSIGIPWCIISDGEQKAIDAVNAALEKENEPLVPQNVNVTVLPQGMAFERYMATTYTQDLIAMAVKAEATNAQHEAALLAGFRSSADPIGDLVAVFEAEKTRYGPLIAQAVVALPQNNVPAVFASAFGRVKTILG